MTLYNLIIIVAVFAVAAGGAYYFLPDQFSFSPATEEKTFVVGILASPPALDSALAGFQHGMQSRGYKEGADIRYIIELVTMDLASGKKSVERLIERNVDLIYAMGVVAARAAKEVTAEKKPNLPVVFGVVSNPIAGKLVKSMQSSGNNLTGVTPNNEIVVSKRLEVFLDMVPSIKRVIFAWNDPNTTGVENLRNAAKTLKVEFVEKRVASVDELKRFLTTFPFRSGDALVRATDTPSAVALREIIALSLEKKIPLSGTNVSDTETGALMSYGANYFKIGEQAARLTDSILKGEKPSDLPIELPEEFEFVINAKTARLLGLTIPASSLDKANRVIR